MALDCFQLMQSLLSPDNAQRGAAESAFGELKKNPEQTVHSLLQVLRGPAPDDVRTMSAVLLRRVILKEESSLYPQCSVETQRALQAQLLQCLDGESVPSVRRKVCDIVGELAAGVLEDEQWPELLPFMFESVNSASSIRKENALRIFGMIGGYIAGSMQPHFDTFNRIFMACIMAADSNDEVKVAAVRAVGMLLICLNSTTDIKHFQSLMQPMIQLVGAALGRGEELVAQDCLEVLIEVADVHPTFFRPALADVVQAMLQVAESTDVDDACRQLSLEFVLCLAERAPSMCRKIPNNFFAVRVIPVIFRLMLEVDEHWAEREEEDECTNFDVGAEALERFVQFIKAKRSLPVAFELIKEYTAQSDWKYRHAGLMALTEIVAFCDGDKKQLKSITESVLQFMKDEHPRVRYAAIQCVGQLAIDHNPLFQGLFHETIIPQLLSVMQDASHPRLQSEAILALVHFIDSLPGELLEPYLEVVLGRLFLLLRDGPLVVQEQAVTAIATVAESARHLFVRFYGTFMPVLKSVLLRCGGSKDIRLLGGKVLECISLIGVSVGKEQFKADALEVMDFMLKEQVGDMEHDDPRRLYILAAFGRICTCLGADFAPYLPMVMPSVLEAATQVAEVSVRELPEEDDDEDDGVELVQAGDKFISVRTSALEDKATACKMIACFVHDLKEVFFPYVEQVAKIMAPLMTESVHDDIRSSAIAVMPDLVLSVSRALTNAPDREPVKQLLEFALGRLLEALPTEPEMELVMTIMQAIKFCVENASTTAAADGKDSHVLGTVVLNEAQLVQLVNALLLVLRDSLQRRAVRIAKRKVEDYDEEEEELDDQADEEDRELQFVWSDCIGGLAKTHRQFFLPTFKHLLLEKIVEMSQVYCRPIDRKTAIFIIDDVLEYCGQEALGLLESFAPILLESVVADDPAIRQAAAYGLGVAARVGGEPFKAYAREASVRLGRVIMAPDAREGSNETATDNAVSALSVLCENYSELLETDKLNNIWLSYLPLRGDVDESRAVSSRLCDLVQSGNKYVLGESGENVPQIVRIFAEVIGTNFCEESVSQRMLQLLKNLQQGASRDVMNATWTALSSEHQVKLQQLLAA